MKIGGGGMVGLILQPAPSGYTGPGDIVPGAAGWWGLRAYNAAYATGSRPAMDINSDNISANPATINILATGELDIATLTTYIGAHSTAFVSKLYDQSGNGLDLTTTATSGPQILLTTLGSRPVMYFVGSSGTLKNTTGFGAISQPWAQSFVFQVVAHSDFHDMFSASDTNIGVKCTNVANNIEVYAGGAAFIDIPANDATFHKLNWRANGDGGLSAYVLDGGAATPITPGTSAWPTGAVGLGNSAGASTEEMYVSEAGFWPSAISNANLTALDGNQHSFYGSPL